MITPRITTTGIETVEDLRAHLQTALQLEHATIPPYFAAWISANEEENREAAQILRSVMLEEMLHLSFVANILNAVGGKPSLTCEGFTPNYPEALPHCGRKFLVSIEQFSPQALKTFLEIELPEAQDAEPQAGEYRTIGQFYSSIANGIVHLAESMGEERLFIGSIDLQVRPEDYYGSGSLIVVHDRDSALKAIEEVKEQGEGTGASPFDLDTAILTEEGREPAHYFRFKQLQLGRSYQSGDTLRSGPTGPLIRVRFESVFPIAKNTKLSNYESASPIYCALEKFCDSYAALLAGIESAFNGDRTKLVDATARMFSLKNQALALARTPNTRESGTNVGLVFTR
jgi:hypothetical protein